MPSVTRMRSACGTASNAPGGAAWMPKPTASEAARITASRRDVMLRPMMSMPTEATMPNMKSNTPPSTAFGISVATGANTPAFGKPLTLGLAALMIVLILAITRYAKGFVRALSLFVTMIIGYLVSAAYGLIDLGSVGRADWVTVPTLFLHGDDDQIVPIGAAAEAAVKIAPKAQLKVYPGGPHGLCTTHKDQINADLLAFLKA